MLVSKQTLYNVVTAVDQDKFISEELGRDVTIIPPLNGVYVDYNVTPFTNELDSFDVRYEIPEYQTFLKNLETLHDPYFKSSKPCCLDYIHVDTVLRGLCTEGKLSPGLYLVFYIW